MGFRAESTCRLSWLLPAEPQVWGAAKKFHEFLPCRFVDDLLTHRVSQNRGGVRQACVSGNLASGRVRHAGRDSGETTSRGCTLTTCRSKVNRDLCYGCDGSSWPSHGCTPFVDTAPCIVATSSGSLRYQVPEFLRDIHQGVAY